MPAIAPSTAGRRARCRYLAAAKEGPRGADVQGVRGRHFQAWLFRPLLRRAWRAAGTRRRYLATVSAQKAAQTLRESEEGAPSVGLSHIPEGAPLGDTTNVGSWREVMRKRIRGGETVPCGICEQPIFEQPIAWNTVKSTTSFRLRRARNARVREPATMACVCNRRKGNRT